MRGFFFYFSIRLIVSVRSFCATAGTLKNTFKTLSNSQRHHPAVSLRVYTLSSLWGWATAIKNRRMGERQAKTTMRKSRSFSNGLYEKRSQNKADLFRFHTRDGFRFQPCRKTAEMRSIISFWLSKGEAIGSPCIRYILYIPMSGLPLLCIFFVSTYRDSIAVTWLVFYSTCSDTCWDNHENPSFFSFLFFSYFVIVSSVLNRVYAASLFRLLSTHFFFRSSVVTTSDKSPHEQM